MRTVHMPEPEPSVFETYVRMGMLAAIRDVQEWVDANSPPKALNLSEKRLRAYLMAMLITAGAPEEHDGGQG